jgi:hypothetical protein
LYGFFGLTDIYLKNKYEINGRVSS